MTSTHFKWCKVCVGLSLWIVASTSSHAQELYKWVDKDGKVQYSDRPPPSDAKKVERKRLGDNKIETDALPFAVRQIMTDHPVVFYTSSCGALCDEARALLTKRGIPFSTRDPSEESVATEMKSKFGGTGVPALAVGSQYVKGFAAEPWHSALDSAGYPRSIPNRVQAPPAPRAPAASTEGAAAPAPN